MDTRYRDICEKMSVKDIAKYLKKKPAMMLYYDLQESLEYLEPEELGYIMKGLFELRSCNVGKTFDQFEDPEWLAAEIKKNRLLGVVWSQVRRQQIESMMQYCAKSKVNAENGRRGGQAKAAAMGEPAAAPSTAASEAAACQEQDDDLEPSGIVIDPADYGYGPEDLLDVDPETGKLRLKTPDEPAEDADPDDDLPESMEPDDRGISIGDYGYTTEDLLDVDPETGELLPKTLAPGEFRPRPWLPNAAGAEGPAQEAYGRDDEHEAPRPRLAYAAGCEDLENLPLPFN